MIENINITGNTVSAAMHAHMYDDVYGCSGVFNCGEKLAFEIASSNEIRIKEGLLINQGRFMRIVAGTQESIAIENGTSGVNRIDLIVAHFETDGVTETHDIRVIKGGANGKEPAYTVGDTFKGAVVNEMPLYAVHLTGLSISKVEQKFTLIKSINEANKILSGTTEPTTEIGNDGDIYILVE